jgi:hypothetical protein
MIKSASEVMVSTLFFKVSFLMVNIAKLSFIGEYGSNSHDVVMETAECKSPMVS